MTRDEIIEQLDGIVGTYEILFGHGVNSDILDADDIEAIKEAISLLSAEREKGEWVPMYDRWGDIVTTVCGYECSKCGEWNADNDNFCPNCGADMRGKADE